MAGGSKNNPRARKAAIQKKFKGQPVKPVKYNGKHAGHGIYIAAQYDNGDLVMNEVENRPYPYSDIH
jgi:hypothetical protein